MENEQSTSGASDDREQEEANKTPDDVVGNVTFDEATVPVNESHADQTLPMNIREQNNVSSAGAGETLVTNTIESAAATAATKIQDDYELQVEDYDNTMEEHRIVLPGDVFAKKFNFNTYLLNHSSEPGYTSLSIFFCKALGMTNLVAKRCSVYSNSLTLYLYKGRITYKAHVQITKAIAGGKVKVIALNEGEDVTWIFARVTPLGDDGTKNKKRHPAGAGQGGVKSKKSQKG